MSDVVLQDDNLVDYYRDLLIIQYADKPKARALMENLLGQLICYDLAVAVRDGFDINTAVGAQLDIIAKYVGVSRVITGTSFTREYFGFAEYGDTSPFDFNPFIKYGDPIPDVQFRNYKESSQSLYALNDEELRVIIKLAILRNNSNASVKDIDTLLNLLFGADVYYIDRMNMTVVSYMLGTAYARIFNIAKSSGLLPNPAAVGTSLIIVPDINHVFSFSLYGGTQPSFAVGFADYYPKWTLIGNPLSISNLGNSSMAYLSSERIALFDSNNDILQAYDFNGINWVPIGDAFPISVSDYSSMCALSSTRIVFCDPGAGTLQVYDFDGINWSAIGNAFTIAAIVGEPDMAALSSSRIAFFDSYNDKLQTYDFDETDWSATGNALSITSGSAALSALSSARIAFIGGGSLRLQTYDFDGTNWASVGSSLSTGATGEPAIASLSSGRVAFCDTGQKLLQIYDFSGSAWSAYGNSLLISAIGKIAMAGISTSRIAFCDEGTDLLRMYDFYQNLTGCMASYS